MAGVYIRGMGLSCALGEGVQNCMPALHRMQAPASRLKLDDFNEPIAMTYYRIPDGAALFGGDRLASLLSPVLSAAVLQAGLNAEEIHRLPLFVGSSCFAIDQLESRYSAALAQHPETAVPMPLCGYQDIAILAQQLLGCAGETYAYNTACTSSANAVLGALRMIELGWCRHALVIGAELANLTTLAGFSGLQLVAEVLQPFDASRNGIVLGEGVSAVVLSAEPNSVSTLRILGGASNCDTSSVTTANPDGNSVASVINQALDSARLQPQRIRGIKAHGTATAMGDTAEAVGMRQVFSNPPPVTVLKPYIGHTLGACCVNELVLFGTALQQGFQPGTPGFETSDPKLGLVPIRTPGAAPDGCYLLNHFGFGGNNTVLVLEKTS